MAGDVTDSGMASEDSPSHLDGRWILESVTMPSDAQVSADARAVPVLTFAGGAIFGTGGVNRFRGTYETDGEVSLTFGGVAATRMAGPATAMSEESRFFAALSATAAFRIGADRLELLGGSGETVAVLVRAEEDTRPEETAPEDARPGNTEPD
ncbi:META domain-containing protein [Nostocoides sp. F2B08]|uniref:META domain-containing protein n=1 Tax=Nostocoides sp. F2B08 TaxID=2653936 RepID=UPI0012638976|nr:META domain-containing protein [Tetrasphaera sp. F2B08]KAB7743024.1 META domain-containing protein [Tetrasphaera sp. F2B08]